jgi:hypothetical protein
MLKNFKRKNIIYIIVCLFILFSNIHGQDIKLLSKAERSNYEETSLYSDIIEFLLYCSSKSNNIHIEYFTKSSEGKDIPLAIISSEGKLDNNKLNIFVIAGVHSGEVDGKEATFVLIRELLFGDKKHILKKSNVFIVPTLNVDGNDKIDKYNRLAQNGPIKGVGLADFPNGMNINRDFSKHEINETEALIKIINKYDPEIIIDCHTTNGSYHAYALTYAPPLNPNTNKQITDFLRKDLLPFVSEKIDKNYNLKMQYYGNFRNRIEPELGWQTFSYLPRYSTNYFGLINRIGVLSESYSYLDIKDRIDITFKFVTEIMDYASQNLDKIKNMISSIDKDNINRRNQYKEEYVSIRCEVYEEKEPIEILLGTVDSVKDETGKGYTFVMRKDVAQPIKVKDYTNFRGIDKIKLPFCYILPNQFSRVINNLLGHGVEVYKILENKKVYAEIFLIDSITRSTSIYQAHEPIRIKGKYREDETNIKEGDYLIFLGQKKSNLLPLLLEPYSEDGYLYWNFFDDYFNLNSDTEEIQYPVIRVIRKENFKIEPFEKDEF